MRFQPRIGSLPITILAVMAVEISAAISNSWLCTAVTAIHLGVLACARFSRFHSLFPSWRMTTPLAPESTFGWPLFHDLIR